MWSSSRPGVATRISTPRAHDRQLLLDVDAAVDDGRAQVGVLAVGPERFLDLDRELAGRREDQRAHRMPRRRGARVRHRQEPLQDRQREAGGLAGAGLGAAHDVLAGEDDGDRLRLDRRGRGVAGLVHGPQQVGRRPSSAKLVALMKAPGRGPSLAGFPVQAAENNVVDSCDASSRPCGPRCIRTFSGGGDRNGRPRANYSLSFGFCEIFLAGTPIAGL